MSLEGKMDAITPAFDWQKEHVEIVKNYVMRRFS
jgi:hypothetical protein